MKRVHTIKLMHRFPLALLLAGGIVLALPQAAQAQRASIEGVDQKLNDVQDTLGQVPGPSDPDIQQQIDALKRQNDILQDMLCSIVPPGAPGALGRCNRIVFITSTSHDGNLGGLDGADGICNERAADAGLPGTYKAWLSDSSASPNTRFNKSNLPYVLVDGTLVATNYMDLTDGSLVAPINRTETNTSPDTFPWTNTGSNGTSSSAVDFDCNDWTDRSNIAFAADFTRTDGFWSAPTIPTLCATPSSIYCFQQ